MERDYLRGSEASNRRTARRYRLNERNIYKIITREGARFKRGNRATFFPETFFKPETMSIGGTPAKE